MARRKSKKTIAKEAAEFVINQVPPGGARRSEVERAAIIRARVVTKGQDKGWSQAQIERRFRIRMGLRATGLFLAKRFASNIPGGAIIKQGAEAIDDIAGYVLKNKDTRRV